MKKVLITGATGFIGRHCLPLLLAKNYEVHATTSRESGDVLPQMHWHKVDLLIPGKAGDLLTRVSPDYLLHLAWYTFPGKYWNSTENFRWVQASLELLGAFAALPGKRVVMAGTCAEYDWRSSQCSERDTPLAPVTLYGTCKHSLQMMLHHWSRQTGLSSAWGRIFHLYGPHEYPGRLVPSVIRALLRGEPANCSDGRQVRDYLYVEDVASAFVALVESELQGPVNIASGVPVSVKVVINQIGEKIGRPDLIRLGALDPTQEPPCLVAATSRLHEEAGWRAHYDLNGGLDRTIDWWRKNANAGELQSNGRGA